MKVLKGIVLAAGLGLLVVSSGCHREEVEDPVDVVIEIPDFDEFEEDFADDLDEFSDETALSDTTESS